MKKKDPLTIPPPNQFLGCAAVNGPKNLCHAPATPQTRPGHAAGRAGTPQFRSGSGALRCNASQNKKQTRFQTFFFVVYRDKIVHDFSRSWNSQGPKGRRLKSQTSMAPWVIRGQQLIQLLTTQISVEMCQLMLKKLTNKEETIHFSYRMYRRTIRDIGVWHFYVRFPYITNLTTPAPKASVPHDANMSNGNIGWRSNLLQSNETVSMSTYTAESISQHLIVCNPAS